MDKLLVFLMAGGSAAGKSTTSKAFAIGKPEEHSGKFVVPMRQGEEFKKVSWTVYDNCALAGNHHSGTDANNGPGAVRKAFHKCIELSDVVIVDGKINSPQWVEMVNDEQDYHDVMLVVLYFNISAEELLTRLACRRGVEKESIRDSMYEKCRIAMTRADLLVSNTHKLAKVPYTIVEIDDETSTEEIVYMMDQQVHAFFGGCDEE